MAKTMQRPSALGGPQSGPVADAFGGWERGVILETVTATDDASVTLVGKLPPFSKVVATQIKCSAAGTVTTGTALALGTSSDPDQLDEVTFTSIDAVGDIAMTVPDTALFTGADEQALQIASTNGSGTAAGEIDTGSWDIAVWYDRFIPFATAT